MEELAMRLAIGTLIWALGAAGAWAQVDTPQNCHWVAVTNNPSVIEMWCRDPDGQAHPTGKTMRQAPPDTWSGCPRGRIYDGARCVSEARALQQANRLWDDLPPPAPSVSPGPPPRSQPRVLLFQDRKGRRGRGMACVDQAQATICKPIPHY
jgi:hypothetical protein